MDSSFSIILLVLAALGASTIASITGFGGAILLLPILTTLFSVQEAISILTIAQLIGNGGRAWFNREQIDRRIIVWFAIGGVPAAIVGSIFFALTETSVLRRGLGYFLILMVIVVGIAAGAVAAVSRFGMGCLVTSVLSQQAATKLAVAAVSIRILCSGWSSVCSCSAELVGNSIRMIHKIVRELKIVEHHCQ